MLFWGKSADRSCLNVVRSAIVLTGFCNSGEPMQNVKPTDLPCVSDHLSPVSAVVNRVVSIAPAPLLPGEQEADYAEFALAIVKAAHPKDAIEDLLTRDVIDLSWEVLRLRRLKAGLLRGAISSSIYQVMCRLGYEHEYAGSLPPTGRPKGKLHRKKSRRASEGATDDGRRDGRDARGQDRLI